MKLIQLSNLAKAIVVAIYGNAIITSSALAAVVADSTMGSLVNAPAESGISYNITGGTASGVNVFHSFSQFDVQANESAFFNSSANPDVNAIIARVTGSNGASIHGSLTADKSLVLISPNGITVGPSAMIQTEGSLLLTTANYLVAGDKKFYADPNNPESDLSLNFRSDSIHGAGFGFIQNEAITDEHWDIDIHAGSTIQPNMNFMHTFSIAGRNVNIHDGTLCDPGCRSIHVAAVRNSENWPYYFGEYQDGGLASEYGQANDFSFGGTVFLSNVTINDYPYAIMGKDVRIIGVSRFDNPDYYYAYSHIRANNIMIGDPESTENTIQFGNDIIGAENRLYLSLYAQDILSVSNTRFFSNAMNGYVDLKLISNGDLSLNNVSIDSIDTMNPEFQKFYRAKVLLEGTESVLLTNSSIALGFSASGSNNYNPQSSIAIKSSNGDVTLDGSTLSISQQEGLILGYEGMGDPFIRDLGTIEIDAENIILRTRHQHSTDTNVVESTASTIVADRALSLQQRGTVSLSATNSIDISGAGTGIFANTGEKDLQAIMDSSGRSESYESRLELFDFSNQVVGNINLNANTINIADGGAVSAVTYGAGDAGNINISAQNFYIDNGRISSSVDAAQLQNGLFQGAGGSIEVIADHIEITNNSKIDSATLGRGDAGNIHLDASSSTLLLINSSIISNTNSAANAGDITLTGKDYAQQGGLVSTSSSGSGNAGNIAIGSANGQSLSGFSLTEGGDIYAFTSENGGGGTISINNSGVMNISGTVSDNSEISIAAKGNNSGQISSLNLSGSSISLNHAVIDAQTASTQRHDQAAAIVVSSTGAVTVSNSQITTTSTGANDAGSIVLVGNGIILTDNVEIASAASGNATGAAGGVSITGNTLQVSDTSVATTSGAQAANGTANIALTAQAGDLSLTNTTISGDSTGGANAGSITLTGHAYTQRGGRVTSTSSGAGDAGSITITGNSGALNNFALTDGGDIKASTSGSGNAGAITIANNGNFVMTGANNDKAEISVSAEGNSSGTIQPLVIAGSNITLTDARIAATTAASTPHNTVANIRLQTSGNVSLDDSDITTETTGATAAGNISIGSADQPVTHLAMRGDSNITSSTTGAGQAGTIDIHAHQEVSLIGGNATDIATTQALQARAIVASSGGMKESPTIASNGAGAGNGGAGKINITTANLTLENASITTSAEGTNGGDITLNVSDQLTLDRSLIAANTTGNTNADLTAGSVLVNPSSSDAGAIALINGSAITANAAGFAQGGEVRLNSKSLFVSWDSAITADSELGVTGNVEQSAPEFDESGLVEELQIPLLDASDLLSRSCDTTGQRSSFVQRHALRNRQPTDFVPVKVPMRPTQLTESGNTTTPIWMVPTEAALYSENELCNRAFLQSSL